MNLSLAIASFVAAGIGLLTLILQLALMARFDTLKKEVLAAAKNANSTPRRSSRDANPSRTRSSERKGSRSEQRDTPARPKNPRVAAGAVENSLRDINLRLKNAERSQEAARREVQESASGESQGSDDAKAENAQPRRSSRNSRGRRRRSGRNSRDNRSSSRDNASSAPKESSDTPAVPKEQPSAEPRQKPAADDNQRVVVKRRVLNENDQNGSGESPSDTPAPRAEKSQPEPSANTSGSVSFGRQSRSPERKESTKAADKAPPPPAEEKSTSDETPTRETMFGRR